MDETNQVSEKICSVFHTRVSLMILLLLLLTGQEKKSKGGFVCEIIQSVFLYRAKTSFLHFPFNDSSLPVQTLHCHVQVNSLKWNEMNLQLRDERRSRFSCNNGSNLFLQRKLKSKVWSIFYSGHCYQYNREELGHLKWRKNYDSNQTQQVHFIYERKEENLLSPILIDFPF